MFRQAATAGVVSGILALGCPALQIGEYHVSVNGND
jgi:hypothetical protein